SLTWSRAPRDLHSFLHDALPISIEPLSASATCRCGARPRVTRTRTTDATPALVVISVATGTAVTGGNGADASGGAARRLSQAARSEEHTSELQSRSDLVCRLLLE